MKKAIFREYCPGCGHTCPGEKRPAKPNPRSCWIGHPDTSPRTWAGADYPDYGDDEPIPYTLITFAETNRLSDYLRTMLDRPQELGMRFDRRA